jgi:hypothetical protein
MSRRQRVWLLAIVLLVGGASLGWWLLAAPGSGLAGIRFLRFQKDTNVTPMATPTNLPPAPTETLLPTLELPTPESLTPLILEWVSAPTYVAESQPGYAARLQYDDSLWAMTVDELGSPALVHRQIPYCQIAPAAGRGLPRGWQQTDDQFRYIGPVQFEVVTISQNGVTQFANYFGGDGITLTGFQVSFQSQMDECLRAAETVLATLSSTSAPISNP